MHREFTVYERTAHFNAVLLGATFVVPNQVVFRWKLQEVIEDMFELDLNMKNAKHTDNFNNRESRYQIILSENEQPILVRI